MSTLLLLAFLIVLPDVSASSADTVYAIPEVTVTATRLERSTFESTAHIDVVDGDVARRAGARHLGDVLQKSTGTFIRRYGAAGLASIALRGTGASQTAILLDGRRLTDPQLGQLDLTLLPAAIIKRVEVMNGTASPLYGADAIGGAVQLLTTPPATGTHVNVEAGAGAFGMQDAALSVGTAHGPFSLTLSADTESAENDYPYFSRALRRDLYLENADRRRSSFYGSARVVTSGIDLRLSALNTRAERGLEGMSAASRHERQWDRSNRVWGELQFGSTTRQFRVGGLLQQGEIRYVNDLTDIDQTGSNRVVSVDAEVTQNLPGSWRLIGGMEAGFARAHHPHLDKVREQRAAIFLQTMGEMRGVLVNGAIRSDGYWNPDEPGGLTYGTINPRIGVSLPLAEAVRIRASVARGFRPPTFNDRYWMPGGNPDLRPERGWTRDAGLVFQTARLSADLTTFFVSTRDQIVWIPVSGTVWSPQNLANTRSVGVETSIRIQQPLGSALLQTNLSYSFTHARDRSIESQGQFLRYVPRDLVRAGVSLRRGRFEGALAIDYTGRRYINADGSDWLEPFLTASVRVSTSFDIGGAQLRSGIIIENLFDAEYAIVAGHPMPPRHLRLTIAVITSDN